MSTYVAIGSAHLDVIARSAGDPHGLDQPGTAKIEVGGTACNIAINWARLGAKSRLLTSTDGSALSKMVISHIEHQNVEVIADHSDSSGVGVFSAHLNPSGELKSAISHMPIENHSFSESAFDVALHDAKYVILDCNLSPHELSAASIECLARAIPFAVAGVSQEKCLKINTIRSMPSLVCLNLQESQYFLQSILGKRVKDPIDCVVALADHMRSPCVVTVGASGSIFYDGKSAPIWERPEKTAERGNRLGAGDGFLAAFVHAMDMVEDKSPKHALNRAMRIASLMANREHANLGTARPLDRAFEELGAKAHRDQLTGLANRAGAYAGLEKRKGSSTTFPLGVLLLDIDHFKKVNDALGHDQGDVAIKGVSSLMNSCLRVEDIASRWGGEEFVCLLPGSTKEEALAVAERIRATVEKATILPNWPLTVSIGVCVGDQDDTLESSLKKADQALYQAKSQGRNKVVTS